ncbi:MAG: hypothetical protein RIR12_2271 [Bacteroidota bacterium]|jgi:hypothetical protein
MKKNTDFILRIPRKLYTKDLQRMFDFLRFKKATANSKPSQKSIDLLVESVQKSRNEKKQAQQYL